MLVIFSGEVPFLDSTALALGILVNVAGDSTAYSNWVFKGFISCEFADLTDCSETNLSVFSASSALVEESLTGARWFLACFDGLSCFDVTELAKFATL